MFGANQPTILEFVLATRTDASENDTDASPPQFSPLMSPSSAFLLQVKREFLARSLGFADDVVQNQFFFEGNSLESHGVSAILSKRQGYVAASFEANLSTLRITFNDFRSYRVANDEFLYINLYRNATFPRSCSDLNLVGHSSSIRMQSTIVIQIRAYAPIEVIFRATNAICLAVFVFGILFAWAGNPLPLSHHAGSVAMLSLLHYAQEDGQQLPLTINILQVSLGSSKYRYLVASLIVNTSVVVAMFLTHFVVASFTRSGIGRLRYPYYSLVIFMHLAPGTWYCFGRNIGNLNVEQYILNVAVALAFGYLTWLGFRFLILSAIAAKYLPHKDVYGQLINYEETGKATVQVNNRDAQVPDSQLFFPGAVELEHLETRYDATCHRPHARLFIDRFMKKQWPMWWVRLMLTLDEEHGQWKAIDVDGTFLDSSGYVIQSYTKKGRLWMGFEQLDFILVSLITLIDNYTTWLAVLQFGITMIVKIIMFVVGSWMHPPRRNATAILLQTLYLTEAVIMASLVIGSVSKNIIPFSRVIHDVGCFLCSILLACDVVAALAFSSAIAWCNTQVQRDSLTSKSNQTVSFPLETASHVPLELVEGHIANSEFGRQASHRLSLSDALEMKLHGTKKQTPLLVPQSRDSPEPQRHNRRLRASVIVMIPEGEENPIDEDIRVMVDGERVVTDSNVPQPLVDSLLRETGLVSL